MHLHALIKIVNDTIESTGTPYDELNAREKNTRDAMFAITVLAPIAGAFLAANFAPGPDFDWARRPGGSAHARESSDKNDCEEERAKSFRYNKIAALWFLSVGIFGALQYLQSGRSTRSTFVFALAHNQIEVLLICLLLKLPTTFSVGAAIVHGFVMYPMAMFARSMATVYISVAVTGGAIDFFIASLLFYGQQWILAIGAFGHVFTAISVFTDIIDNFGVLPYNLCIFLGLWTHIGFTVIGILYARELCLKKQTLSSSRDTEGKGSGKRPRSPKQNELDIERRAACYAWNPMWQVQVQPSTLLAIVALSLVGSTLITVVLVNWVPLWDAKHPSPLVTLSRIWGVRSNNPSLVRY